jgi:hypothetical protein
MAQTTENNLQQTIVGDSASSFNLGQSTTIHFEAEQNNNQKKKHEACALCPGYHSKWAMRCGACQMACGFILTLLGITAYCLYFDEFWKQHSPNDYDIPKVQRMHRCHVGIWGGLFTMTTGIVGISSAIVKRRYVIVLCLVMSVISALASTATIAIAILSINKDRNVLVDGYLANNQTNNVAYALVWLEILKSRFAVNASLILFASVEIVPALLQIIFCGRARRKSADLTGGMRMSPDIPKGLTTEGESYFWIPLPAHPKQSLQVTFGPTINSGEGSYYLTVSHPEGLNTAR